MKDKPSRKIPKNYRNITGLFYSNKAKRHIAFESKLERDFLTLFEFDERVTEILEQPYTIEYTYQGKDCRYTPDFMIKLDYSGTSQLIEVKYYDDFKNNYQELKQKFYAGRDYAKNELHKTKYKIFTEKCPLVQNENYLFNARFLLQFNTFNYDNLDKVLNIFKYQMTIDEIAQQVSSDKYEQLAFIRDMWAMVRHKIVKVNLQHRIGLDTVIISVKRRGYEF